MTTRILLAAVSIWLAACLFREYRWRTRRRRIAPVQAPQRAARLRHPVFTMRGPVPRDGRPLDAYEERILGRISIDALIDIAEPDYSPRRRS